MYSTRKIARIADVVRAAGRGIRFVGNNYHLAREGITHVKHQFTLSISYRSTIIRKVKKIHQRLEEFLGQGKVFLDTANAGEIAGMDGPVRLFSALMGKSKAVVVLFTKDYGESRWTRKEWDAICQGDPERIIPVSIDGIWPGFIGAPGDMFHLNLADSAADNVAVEILKYGAERGLWVLSKSKRSSLDALTGQPARRKQKNALPDTGDVTSSGTIIVGDIANFSAIASGNMSNTLAVLWDCASAAGLLTEHHSTLLDGVVIAIQNAAYGKTVAACGEWMRLFRVQMHDSLELRIAIHRGDYCRSIRKTPSGAHVLLAGQAPNECSRLVRMAGPGQMVISEAYIHSWSDYEGWNHENPGEAAEFRPILSFDGESPTHPHETEIKPGKISRFRFYKYNLNLAVFDRHILMKNRARQGLEKWIVETAEDFLEFLSRVELESQSAPGADIGDSTPFRPADLAERIDLRVSVFVFERPDPKTKQLGAILRYSPGDEPRWERNSTRYSVSDEHGEGPIGRAFFEKQPQVLSNLPDFSSHPVDYTEVLCCAPWLMDAGKIKRFQRKARCFIAVPLCMSSALSPEAVLCVDTTDPLNWLDDGILLEWGAWIADLYGITGSALVCLLNG